MNERKGIIIYTDGGCIGNPGPGGYGVILRHNGREKQLSGGFRLTTNNRMEMQGAIEALHATDDHPKIPIVIISDSDYLVKSMNENRIAKWKREGWINSSGKPTPNKDLWKILRKAVKGRKVTWQWVKGHSGVYGNERADGLALAARQSLAADDDIPF